MSFLLTFLIVFTTAAGLALVSVRKFFLTSDAAGYAFVAINWALLLGATAIFALLIKLVTGFFAG